ncbi:MAG: diaminopimelate epimerase [Gammaproteobacteria bacterium]
MRLPFVKMHGLGNDFVVIDNRDGRYALSREQFAALGTRRFGIGCDQILLLERAHEPAAHARYRVVNADGSPAEHCGNGVRCVARYLERLGEVSERVAIEIGDAVYELTFGKGTDVRVDMGVPCFDPTRIPLAVPAAAGRYAIAVSGTTIEFGAVSMGNPHAVIAVADTEQADVAGIGAALQSSALFPASVNVGFLEVTARDRVRLRVFERGAGETLACGTGACAAVAIGRRWHLLDARVTVVLRGGELTIEWAGGATDALWMTGPATFVFEGTIEL